MLHIFQVESGVKQILLAILHDLNKKDLMKFKWLLQLTLFEKSLQQISWSHLECADQADIVDLMVKIGGQQSVEVTKEVLMDMNRTDLVERLSHTSKGKTKKTKDATLQLYVSHKCLINKYLIDTYCMLYSHYGH